MWGNEFSGTVDEDHFSNLLNQILPLTIEQQQKSYVHYFLKWLFHFSTTILRLECKIPLKVRVLKQVLETSSTAAMEVGKNAVLVVIMVLLLSYPVQMSLK